MIGVFITVAIFASIMIFAIATSESNALIVIPSVAVIFGTGLGLGYLLRWKFEP